MMIGRTAVNALNAWRISLAKTHRGGVGTDLLCGQQYSCTHASAASCSQTFASQSLYIIIYGILTGAVRSLYLIVHSALTDVIAHRKYDALVPFRLMCHNLYSHIVGACVLAAPRRDCAVPSTHAQFLRLTK